MRLLHTSDWHLGRLFHQVHLTEDQAHVLDQFVALAADARPDAVLLSGDVYDRGVPPAEAVELLGGTLERLTGDLGLRVVLISGNHDSPERLGFGARLLDRGGLHIAGSFARALEPVVLEDGHGPVHVHALPYLEPAEARQALGRDDLHDHDASLRAQVQAIRERIPGRTRSVLLAHAFVAGGEASDSERPLTVGGAGTVGADAFAGFDYVALGHLHRPQSVVGNRVAYSGSLMKYSFSEASHGKSVTLVEMGADGTCMTERIPLTPRRDVRIVTGLMRELLDGSDDGPRDDYVLVRLRDEGALLDPMGRLREVFPNVLGMEFVDRDRPAEAEGGSLGDHRKRTPEDLFRDFHDQVTGEALTGDQEAAFAEVVAEVMRGDREGGAA